ACHESTIVFWADVLKRLKAGVYWNIRIMLSIYVTTVGFECMTSAAYVHVSAANEDKRKVNAAKGKKLVLEMNVIVTTAELYTTRRKSDERREVIVVAGAIEDLGIIEIGTVRSRNVNLNVEKL
ncbi:hypothetical protein Tco_1022755, partial [Tanacetum coccineum]